MNIKPELPDSSGRAYLVGGSVRDMLRGQQPVDYDIAVLENPQKYARELAEKNRSRVIKIGKSGKNVFRVICGDVIFDISRAKGTTIEEDLRQRDFTINALAYAMDSGEIIDVTGGRKDLTGRCIRMVSSSIFQRDPVRLLRAYRITAMTGFNLETHTTAAIRQNRQLIRLAAGERVRDELFGILNGEAAAPPIAGMADSGLLMEIFPELADLAGCRQNRHHEFDALEHTLKMFGHLETHLNRLEHYYPQNAEALNPMMGKKRKAILKCAALLHDIGKPAAMTTDDMGHRHFYGHEKIGAQLADKVGLRYRFSNHERESMALIVRSHLRPLFLFNRPQTTRPDTKARTRFFMACGALVPDLILHAVADRRGKKADPDENHNAFVRFADDLLRHYFSGFRPRKSAPPLINGHDLIRVFGLSPSPLFTTLLAQVEEARLTGEINCRDEAVQLVEAILQNHIVA